MKIHSIFHSVFKEYGQVLTGYDLHSFCEVFDRSVSLPEHPAYVPGDPCLEAHPAAQFFQNNVYGGTHTFFALLHKRGKWPYYHYHFEIQGLCELEFDGKLYCSILGSLDDLDYELELLSAGYDFPQMGYDFPQNGNKEIARTGFASFDGKSYLFTVRVNLDEDSWGWELYDENLQVYSRAFHSFSKQWPTAKGVEIVAAP